MSFKSFKETFDKINSSEIFQNFTTKNSDAELCAGFFILDFIGNDNKYSLDYKFGEKIYTFNLTENDKITIQEDKLMDLPIDSQNKYQQKLEKINFPIIDLNEVKTAAELKAIDNNIKSRFQKIIAVLQIYKGPETNDEKIQVWNLTCILDSLIILNMIVDSNNGKVLSLEKSSLADMFKRAD